MLNAQIVKFCEICSKTKCSFIELKCHENILKIFSQMLDAYFLGYLEDESEEYQTKIIQKIKKYTKICANCQRKKPKLALVIKKELNSKSSPRKEKRNKAKNVINFRKHFKK